LKNIHQDFPKGITMTNIPVAAVAEEKPLTAPAVAPTIDKSGDKPAAKPSEPQK
jgi:hypothetical protein